MRVRSGTSGFSYKEWKGIFYPEGTPDSAMLAYYATRLSSVEINNTFYRMPRPDVVASWASQVGEGFRFAIKASRRITHQSKLKNVADSIAYLSQNLAALKDTLGVVLYQLPPTFRADRAVLSDFLAQLPQGQRAALEVRHPSWFDDAVYEMLHQANVALCTGDAEESRDSPPFVATADFGYLRLRAPEYDDASLATWALRVTEQAWADAFVFFKHESQGPLLAERFAILTADGRVAARPAPLAKTSPRPKRKIRSGQA